MLRLYKVADKTSVHEKAGLLRDSVFAANDGIITTFAIVAGSTGASLSASIVVILGLVNLLADGISMASGNYLGVKSELDYEEAEGDHTHDGDSPAKHGLITLVAFSLVGFLPLLPYIFDIEPKFKLSAGIVGFLLFSIGSSRGRLTKKNWIKSGSEMLFVGGLAALVAYGVGFFARRYVL